VTKDCRLRIADFGLARERPTGHGKDPDEEIDGMLWPWPCVLSRVTVPCVMSSKASSRKLPSNFSVSIFNVAVNCRLTETNITYNQICFSLVGCQIRALNI
jgi:hypothetical protein